MSQKRNLQSRIDALCAEQGLTETPYTDKTTLAELEAILEKLEAKTGDNGSLITDGFMMSRIDALCAEQGLEKPYTDKTTLAELEAILEQLEAKTGSADTPLTDGFIMAIPLTTVIIVGANGHDEELKAGEPALMSPELVAELAESGLVAEFTE